MFKFYLLLLFCILINASVLINTNNKNSELNANIKPKELILNQNKGDSGTKKSSFLSRLRKKKVIEETNTNDSLEDSEEESSSIDEDDKEGEKKNDTSTWSVDDDFLDKKPNTNSKANKLKTSVKGAFGAGVSALKALFAKLNNMDVNAFIKAAMIQYKDKIILFFEKRHLNFMIPPFKKYIGDNDKE
ncbi:hypothetical protein K502DRAFT_361813 [Neoconidiobolus thromboides FSU 785]|nr:hypothetical protein K502DRAFT_361813 [Neoconidiobolus thromboides FSU 785]